jgi:hypothetical protein
VGYPQTVVGVQIRGGRGTGPAAPGIRARTGENGRGWAGSRAIGRPFGRKNRRNTFVINVCREIYARNQKELDSRAQVSIVAPPSSNVPRKNVATQEATTSKTPFLPSSHSVFDGNSIDGEKAGCLSGNLSLGGKRFFEIYFVRLIGTPNQP